MANNYQFGRFVEVEVRNFDSQIKTVIGNEFEIEFEYHKSLDQTQQDDSGKIKIYGLTKERVESMQSEGGEVRLRCGYLNSEIETLFIASISRLYSNTTNNISETVIECSANLLNYYYSSGISVSESSSPTIVNIAALFGKELGANKTVIQLPRSSGLPENLLGVIEEFTKTYYVKQSYVGSLNQTLSDFCETFKLNYSKEENSDGSFTAVFEVTELGAVDILKISQDGYTSVTEDVERYKKEVSFRGLLKASDDSTSVVVLDPQTGLIEAKTEYKIATAYIDEELSEDDVETIKSQQSRLNKAVRDANKKAKDEKRAAEAAKKGKRFISSGWKKQQTIKVSRRYNRVKALLNPMVKPQSAVAVLESKSVEDDVKTSGGLVYESAGEYVQYRVRNATYKGNNKRNDWIMDLYCEDSDSTNRSQEELKKLQYTTASEDIQVEDVEVEGLEGLINE